MTLHEFTRTTVIAAKTPDVWARITTLEGINDELKPVMRMLMPQRHRRLTIETLPAGRPLGRVWILLLGVVPFDYDDMTVAEVEPGKRFLERSSMGSMRRWEHERTITTLADGHTQISDRIGFEPRLGLRLAMPVLAYLIPKFFEHRHRRLRAHFLPD